MAVTLTTPKSIEGKTKIAFMTARDGQKFTHQAPSSDDGPQSLKRSSILQNKRHNGNVLS